MRVLGMIDVLGTEYVITEQSVNENPKLKDNIGLCEQYSKEIVITDSKEYEDDIMRVDNFDMYIRKVLRHEIIHAFLGEAGLRTESAWAENEEMIDFFAIQIEKIVKAMIEAKCFSLDETVLKEAGKSAGSKNIQQVLKPAT